MIGLNKEYNHSFISELMYIKKNVVEDILNRFFDSSFSNFVSNTLDNLSDDSFISEYEFYGNYCLKYFPDTYNFKHVNSKLNGKHSCWDDEEIENIIEDYKNTYDLITIHSWIQ
jgi:Fe2+ or Zn2+ uptake regulation protein